MKTVGIIGGMGPLATIDLFNKIVTMTNAKCDNDHIHILIDNNTKIPDRTSFILGNGENPTYELEKSAKHLEEIGADFLVIPCNTAHYFYNNIKNGVNIEVINMIEETAKSIASSGIKKVGLLSTTGTIKAKVYDSIFEKYDIELIKPNEYGQSVIMDLIYGIKEGREVSDKKNMMDILNYLKEQGAFYIILGCTELPIAVKMLEIEGNFIDPTSILARVAVSKAI
ncbi:aspartate/glutamate racemase family protein [Romboutsia sp.]|uniref:aspartate/glutamate racemase family protein n=1 Tax=Romboutsia sp. TaxID=1965302 RepID=UPI002BF1DEE7|nr:amino acid racemase [Romboutsia sp.]HSQ89794.1 amino acid racemase [Romboutsia sp.]